MQIPANYDNVIGVVATNPIESDPVISIQEVMGDVAAPGGEGGVNPDDPNDLCAPRADTWNKPEGPSRGPVCTRPEDCAFVVIGLARTRYGEQYVYWSGTSFAAPMVSGMQHWRMSKWERLKPNALSMEVPINNDAGS